MDRHIDINMHTSSHTHTHCWARAHKILHTHLAITTRCPDSGSNPFHESAWKCCFAASRLFFVYPLSVGLSVCLVAHIVSFSVMWRSWCSPPSNTCVLKCWSDATRVFWSRGMSWNVHKRLGSSLGIPFWFKMHPSNNRPLDLPKNGDFPLGETTKVKSRWESVDDSGRPYQAGASGMLDVAASSGGTLW